MKKFLIFLISIVVVVSLGLVTFYFLRNDEVITVGTKEIYCNVGDTISLNDLNIKIKKSTKKTTFNYNAGGEEVTDLISFDKDKGYYIVSNTKGGDVDLLITTSNKKYSRFKIAVHIGDGSAAHPYFIFNETKLSKIGVDYRLDSSSNYKLMNDIVLTSEFKGIGFSSVSNAWEGFDGTFDGNGHRISGLNIAENKANAGLFSSLNTNAIVKNLTVDNVSLSGEFDNAGALAGTIAGNVKNVSVSNVSINNTKLGGNSGAFAGTISGAVQTSSATKSNLVAGSETASVTSANLGGFAGVVDNGTVQACFVNSTNLNMFADGNVGGFVGNFVVGEKFGTIQQSYASVSCDNVNFGAFVGAIDSTAVDVENGKYMLRHLVGNAVVTGKTVITDGDLVKTFDATYFANKAYEGQSVFYHVDAALYMIQPFANSQDMINAGEYVFYALNTTDKTLWDSTYVWFIHTNELPTLRFGATQIGEASGAYYLRDTSSKYINTNFIDTFNADKEAEKFEILQDCDISDSDWTPVSLTNCSIDGLKEDGTNAVITVKLNNAKDGNLGLFNQLKGCTVKNIDIVIKEVGANATNFGGLAAEIAKSDIGASQIENVNVIFETAVAKDFAWFGGIAGKLDNSTIENCSVEGLNAGNGSAIENAGALVGQSTSASVKNSEIKSATIYATKLLGGAVADNSGSVLGISGNVQLFNAQKVGGVVANNNAGAEVQNSTLNVEIAIQTASGETFVGGVAAINDGIINNVKVVGTGIEIAETVSNKVNVGGVAATNNSEITKGYNLFTSVGTYVAGKEFYVGGVVVTNNGKISQCVAGSNLYGNYVGGVAVYMNGNEINQVLVGKYVYNEETGSYSIEKNILQADKFVAGVVYDIESGKISNVQCVSNIHASANETHASLNALIAPSGTISHITIDSTFEGSAGASHKYINTWTDYTTEKPNSGVKGQFNIYSSDVCEMTNVVINGLSNSDSDLINNAYNGTNFVITLNNEQFADATSFNKTYKVKVGKKQVIFVWDVEEDKTLTFEVGTEDGATAWVANNGISLRFLQEVK